MTGRFVVLLIINGIYLWLLYPLNCILFTCTVLRSLRSRLLITILFGNTRVRWNMGGSLYVLHNIFWSTFALTPNNKIPLFSLLLWYALHFIFWALTLHLVISAILFRRFELVCFILYIYSIWKFIILFRSRVWAFTSEKITVFNPIW